MAEKRGKTEALSGKAASAAEMASEPIYTVGELAAEAGKLFGTREECVKAAFKEEKKREAALSEAIEIVKKFMRKEIQ